MCFHNSNQNMNNTQQEKIIKLTEASWVSRGTLPEDLHLNEDEFELFWNMRPGFRNKIKMFGKTMDMPREQQVYGISNYRYSGVTFDTKEMSSFLDTYLEWANMHDGGEHKYNMVLVNWYHNGKDNIGWHKDNEKEIKPGTNVMTISFGETRLFKIKHDTKDIKQDIPTVHNSFVIMGGDFQKEFKHSIPKTSDKKKQRRRISITMRKFN